LLSENNTGKYLKYAVGEIMLVVIGILIALSINNWNEVRKDRIEEQKVLKTLKSNFESNKTQLRDNINETEELVSDCDKNLELFKLTQSELNLLSKDSIRIRFRGYATFNPSDGALTSLLQSGHLNIIVNDSLKNKLTNWPNLVNDAKEDENLLVEKITKDLLKQLIKYQSYIKNPKFKLNRLAIFDDFILQNTIVFVRGGGNYQIYLYKELESEIDQILNLIDEEISSDKN